MISPCPWWADGQHLFEVGSHNLYGAFRKADSAFDHITLKGCRCGEVVELAGAKPPPKQTLRSVRIIPPRTAS